MKTEHSILLANHRCATEQLVNGSLANYLVSLGNLRTFMKKSLSYLPILGWTWALQENVLLERNLKKDQDKLGKHLFSLLRHSDPFIFNFFPEGTRFTKEKHTAGMKIAKEKGLIELQHHLLPRTKGFVTFVQNLKKNVDNTKPLPVSIIDTLIVIQVGGSELATWTFSDALQGKAADVKIVLRRYCLQDIPFENSSDEEECTKWLQKRYQEKDKLMQNYMNSPNSNFFPDANEALPSFQLPKSRKMLSFGIFWDIVLLVPLVSHFIKILTHGNYLQLNLVLGVVFLIRYVYKALIDGLHNDNCSDYGKMTK